VDAWVLSNHSVYRVPLHGHVDTWSLQGQLQRDAFVVYRGAVFVGTTEGVMRFAPDEPDVSLDFRDGASGPIGNARPAIYFASVAFDTVLLSGLNTVYAVGKSGKDASRTSLPPGRAYGQNPYWWVTKSGVYRLAPDFSVSEPLTIEQPASDPVVVAERLWFASHSYRLISVPKDARAEAVPNIPGRVLSVSAAQGVDGGTVWAATDKALERVHLTGTAKDRPTFIVSDEVTEGNIEKVLVLGDRLFFRRCATQNDPKDSDRGCSPTVLEELIANGHVDRAQEREVAKGAGDFWMADAETGVLYVPTDKGLIKYLFAKRKADTYDRPSRFVFQWGASLLLGSALPAETIQQPAAGAVPENPPGRGDRFANLCAFEPDAKLSAKLSGADAFDWYVELFGTHILYGADQSFNIAVATEAAAYGEYARTQNIEDMLPLFKKAMDLYDQALNADPQEKYMRRQRDRLRVAQTNIENVRKQYELQQADAKKAEEAARVVIEKQQQDLRRKAEIEAACKDTNPDSAEEMKFRPMARARVAAMEVEITSQQSQDLMGFGQRTYGLNELKSYRVVCQEIDRKKTLARKLKDYDETFKAFVADGKLTLDERAQLKDLQKTMALEDAEVQSVESKYAFKDQTKVAQAPAKPSVPAKPAVKKPGTTTVAGAPASGTTNIPAKPGIQSPPTKK